LGRSGRGKVATDISVSFHKDSQDENNTFQPDYAINPLVPHDAVLEEKGNDFMNVQLHNDTAYAVWGDVRNGSLKIYLNKWNIRSGTASMSTIYDEKELHLSPNPATEWIQIPTEFLQKNYQLFAQNGQLIEEGTFQNPIFNCEKLRTGTYLFRCVGDKDVVVLRFQKQ
jgi:hypothetical protein